MHFATYQLSCVSVASLVFRLKTAELAEQTDRKIQERLGTHNVSSPA